MALWKLCEWEENGYHDSDWYAAVWNDEAEKVERVLTGTTRGALNGGPKLNTPPTLEVVEKARKWLAEVIFALTRAAEHRDVLEPQNAKIGDELELLKAHTFRNKKEGSTVRVESGERGRVFWIGAFGRFYRNGYNRPGRSNRRVGIELADGRRLFAPLDKCRLAREPLSDAELHERAERLSHGLNFGAALSVRFAWNSTNEAKAVRDEAAANAA